MITPGPPIQRPEWNKKPVDNSQILDLLERIADLRQRHITREAVIFDWMNQRILRNKYEQSSRFVFSSTLFGKFLIEFAFVQEDVDVYRSSY